MANVVKNIDSIIAQAINSPKVDGIPLYSRVDGGTENSFITGKGKSDRWEKKALSSYNSPTNVRKVFISGKYVAVQTYKPSIVDTKPSAKGCWNVFELKDGNNLIECVTSSLNYQQAMNKYYMEKNLDPKAKAPDRITLKGTGLGAISSPWVFSNVEEVYFDWTLLASETYRNAAIGCEELLTAYINGKRGYVPGNMALDMFVMANSCNIKDIRNRFPRLRCVGLISELGSILGADYDKGKTGIESIKDSVILWSKLEKNIELIKKSNSLIVINQINDGTPLYNTNFSLRENIYRYDRDVLKEYIDNYGVRVKEHLRGSVKVSEEVLDEKIEIKDEKSNLEELLDELVETRCLADAKSVLIVALKGAKLSEIKSTFSEMSTAGEKKYRELINYKL